MFIKNEFWKMKEKRRITKQRHRLFNFNESCWKQQIIIRDSLKAFKYEMKKKKNCRLFMAMCVCYECKCAYTHRRRTNPYALCVYIKKKKTWNDEELQMLRNSNRVPALEKIYFVFVFFFLYFASSFRTLT